MATSLKSISGIGADARKLARLLQAKAPEGHMLAYINPREAALLKAHGGSGKPHADTGIPSFEDDVGSIEDYQAGTSDFSGGGDFGPEAITTFTPEGFSYAGPPTTSGAPGTDIQLSSFPQAVETPSFDTSRPSADAVTRQLMGEAAEKPAAKGGISEDTMKRLGIAGVMGLLGARSARAAERAGQAGRRDIQALATPYQQKGQELQAQAQRGELTPQAMQSLQAAQAQAAQGVERRGGVGVAQAQMQVEQLRQQLLQQQYDYGLKLSGIGDNIALGAIKTGLEADRYVQGINNQFYQNMAYIASGMTPGTARG